MGHPRSLRPSRRTLAATLRAPARAAVAFERLGAAEDISIDRVIFFGRKKEVGGYDVRFLDQAMARLAGHQSDMAFFRALRGKALAITFYYEGEGLAGGKLESEPIPQLAIVDCATREEWEQ
ncbi:MAG: hypothetical protein IH797_07120, partial [Chloroflexi bacterium]|nr:hypothetical protein [Chloroflexota bacterium]